MSSRIRGKDVQKIAELARLSLDSKHEKEMVSYFGEIVSYVGALAEVSTEQVAAYDLAKQRQADLRSDEAVEFSARDVLVAGPQFNDDQLLITKAVFEKSLVSAVDIPNDAILTREMLTTKRPGKGLSPKLLPKLIGRRATKNIPHNSLILETDFA